MAVIENSNKLSDDSLIKRIQTLEKRLIKVESLLQLEWVGDKQQSKITEQTESDYSTESTESTVVEYGLAWIGSIVFFLGIIFLMTYIAGLGHPVTSRIIAFGTTFLLLGFAYFMRNSFPILTNVLNFVAIILLFYITASLYFFASEPIIEQRIIVVALLIIISGIQLYIAIQRNSERRAALTLVFLIAITVLVDAGISSLSFLVAAAILSSLLFNSKNWWKLQIFSIFIVYIIHLNWLLGNPILGNKFGLIQDAGASVYFVMAYALAYIMSIFISKEKLKTNGVLVSITVWNALGFSMVMLVSIPAFFAQDYVLLFTGIATFCLAFSVYLKIKEVRSFAPATYATFGFMAISIAIYGMAGLPNAYFIFALQSFLVVSMALWFRSQIIVVTNVFMLLFILGAYLLTSESIDSINFVLAFTALATARILNWQKERLTLKTEIYRNIYLFIAVAMLLYSLNQSLPGNYVTISWTAMAVIFFLLSVQLNNIKYRYLSIITIFITAGHLFFIDLGQMEVGYRVVAFIAFAVISLGVSLYYTKRIRRKE